MQKAEIVLTMLNQKSLNDPTYTFTWLYRNLFNPDFYLNAYAKMYGKEGNMTEGVDGKTIDGFGMQTVIRLIEQIKYERYNPQPVRRVFIPKKNGKMRPLGIPTIEDKLIQEILREILEAIYEPLFNTNSHGFRPNRSCHTALSQIKRTGNGSTWIIEGDIKGFFDNIDHEILLNILGKKIDDGRFINLIGKFLKAGIMEEGKLRDSITGTPQGGIISPLLANIYLNELDRFMETLKEKLEKGDIKKHNPMYRKLANQRQTQLQRGDYKQARETQKQLRQTPTKDQMDENFRRIRYVRYADDFVILLHGTKSFSEQIRTGIAVFLKENLKLELNLEKTLITNLLNEKARFLGYEIIKGMENTRLTKSDKGIKYMEQVKSENEIGKYRRISKEYNRLLSTRTRRKREGKYLEADKVLKQMYKMQAKNPLDPNFRRVKYIRYADDFVVLIHGSKIIAERIRDEVALFLYSKLKLALNMEKTYITNLQKDKARFLGYEIIKAQSYTKMTVNTNGRRQRSAHGQMQLLVPREVIREKIKKFTKNGKPTYINERVTLPIHEMIAVYNTEIRGLVNYYNIANNVSKRLYEFKYYHYFSLAKTLAKKHKMSVKKVIRKFRTPVKRKDGTGTVNIIGVKYRNKTGEQIMTYFNKSIKRKYNPVKEEIQPEIIKTNYKNELIRRLLYGKCELCKENQEVEQLEVHHIRNLKKLKDKYEKKKIELPKWLKIMVHIRRKTLVVCKNCHKIIHKKKI